MATIREWDLVRTADGYYGIVTDARLRYVFLGNGLEEQISEAKWSLLTKMPLNIFNVQGAPANFEGIIRAIVTPPREALEEGA